MSQSSELKPVRCGCGGEAKVISYLSREYCKMAYYVRCVECGTETDDLHTEAEAVQAWNRAMGAKDINVPNKERTAKVIEHDGVVTMDGRKYHHMEYLCGHCKKKVIGGDDYCSHCGCRLDWNEDIPMEYFESGGI